MARPLDFILEQFPGFKAYSDFDVARELYRRDYGDAQKTWFSTPPERSRRPRRSKIIRGTTSEGPQAIRGNHVFENNSIGSGTIRNIHTVPWEKLSHDAWRCQEGPVLSKGFYRFRGYILDFCRHFHTYTGRKPGRLNEHTRARCHIVCMH